MAAVTVLLGPAALPAQVVVPDVVGMLLHAIAPKRIAAPASNTVPAPADAAGKVAGTVHYDGPGSVAQLDIAGVRIGMTVAEANAAAQQLGYTINTTTTTLSFQQEVASRVAQRRNQSFSDTPRNSPSDTEATTRLGARLSIRYVQWPEGARVGVIHYFDSTENRPDTTAFRNQLVSKYGHWSRDSAFDPTWCSAGDAVCAGLGFPRLASIQSNLSVANHVWMMPGSDAVHKAAQLMDAEVDRLAPKAERSAL